jgi:hypothetical protein
VKTPRKVTAVRGIDGRWYASGMLSDDMAVWRALPLQSTVDQQRADEEVARLYPNV